MLKTVIAHSMERDSQDAVEEVLEQCSKVLGELQPQAGILFVAGDHNFPLILNRIVKVHPEIELIGCSSFAEMSSVHGFAEDSIILTLFYCEELHFKAGVAEKISENPFTYLKDAVETAKSSLGQDYKICIVLPSAGYSTDGIEGLQKGLGQTFPIFGGVSDSVFYNNNVFTDAAPFLLIAGPVLFSFAAESGWLPIGQKAKVTQSDGKVVSKIGNQSAADFYKYYLGGTPVADYPLAVFEDDEERFYLRTPWNYDAKNGIVTFSGNVPEGAEVQITYASRDNIIKAARKSVNSAVTEYPGSKPSVTLCFSCATRWGILGTRVEEECQLLMSSFPDLAIAGFYCAGEIGPFNRGKPSILHNDTFYTLLIGSE